MPSATLMVSFATRYVPLCLCHGSKAESLLETEDTRYRIAMAVTVAQCRVPNWLVLCACLRSTP
jgi:hypothetical protein